MKTPRPVRLLGASFSRTFPIVVAALLLVGGAAVSAVAAGPALDILIEEGNSAELDAKQYQQRVELKTYMAKTLPVKCSRHGIEARVIQAKSDYAGGGRQLLVVHYDRYNPGKTAARLIIGFGAGAASLDVTHALYDGDKPVMTWTDGCGTSEHWQRLVNKINDNAVIKLKEHYGLR